MNGPRSCGGNLLCLRQSPQTAAFFAGEDFLGGEAERFGRDLDLGDGGVVGDVYRWVSRGEKCAASGASCGRPIVGRLVG